MGVGSGRGVRHPRPWPGVLRGDGWIGRLHRHRRPGADAGHEPLRPRDEERRDHRRDRERDRDLQPRRDHPHGDEPSRRHVLRGHANHRLPSRACHRDGRGAGHGPLPKLHRSRAGRERRGRSGARSGRSRRQHGAASELGVGRRDSARPTHGAGSYRSAGGPNPKGRRRDRRAAEDRKCLLRSLFGGHPDVRGDRARQEACPALLRLARGRVRPRRHLHGRALQAGTSGPGEDLRSRAGRR